MGLSVILMTISKHKTKNSRRQIPLDSKLGCKEVPSRREDSGPGYPVVKEITDSNGSRTFERSPTFYLYSK